jgi:hypothetical protein
MKPNEYKPKVILDKYYYFDVQNNTIHALKKDSFLYFHELSHYIDMQKPFYVKLSDLATKWGQLSAMIFPVMFFINLNLWLIMYALYSGFIITEEIRAYVNAYNWNRGKFKIQW